MYANDNRIDIIVLGATGFTGKHTVKKLASFNEPECLNVKWGIAGRSPEKLQNLLSDLQNMNVSVSDIPVLDCDINNEESLNAVCQRTKVLMNATGPNTLLSEPIVKSCIANNTHYVDISAELYHMINIYRKYHEAAEKANVLIICGCGFGSLPTIAGLLQLEESFEGKLHSVEGYMELEIPKRAYIPGPNKCLVHYGTWECFVLEMHNYQRYRKLKQLTFPKPEPVPSEIKKCFFHRYREKIWFPYPGPDHDIIEMTQNYLHTKTGKTPYHFQMYTTMPWLIHIILIVPVFFIAYLLCSFRCFKNLLLKYPRFFSLGYFSHNGPSQEMMDDTKYSLTLKGRGWSNLADTNLAPDKTMTLKVSGSDPGYKTTSTTFVLSAVTILEENDKIPKGGVITTSTAFRNTTIIKKLIKHGINFEVIDT